MRENLFQGLLAELLMLAREVSLTEDIWREMSNTSPWSFRSLPKLM